MAPVPAGEEVVWHMTEQQQWTSLLVVLVICAVVVAGLLILLADHRKRTSVEEWTHDFIPDSSEVRVAETIREKMQERKARRGA